MTLRTILAGAALAGLVLATDAAVSAAGAVTVHRGSSGASGATRVATAGVNVYRGAKPVDVDLAGAEPAPGSAQTTIVIVECRRYPSRYLRTQGFYSGHPGESRRFTQGFWSGPADLPKSTARVIRLKRK